MDTKPADNKGDGVSPQQHLRAKVKKHTQDMEPITMTEGCGLFGLGNEWVVVLQKKDWEMKRGDE